jgi:asparagine synthase (glutamine-hydrolysing)
MCGIAGVFDRTGSGRTLPDIAPSVAALAHRGPDETGFWSDPRVSLGMSRLAIIAPEGNHQPAQNEDGRVRVVFNGQIYNHPELRRELEGFGHRFASDGDSEVIAHAYEEWGAGFLDRINGMFGIAVYDCRTEPSLLLARDRMGIKPLYYATCDDRIVFGSELKAVAAVLGERPGLNPQGLLNLLTFEYIPAPHTLFDGIQKLEPGHLLRVERECVEKRAYWSLPVEGREISEAEAIGEVQTLVADAVQTRMISDVPLGAFLSGGIDSSIIVALMSRFSDRPVKTFSVGFEDASYNETAYAKMVADRYKTEHHEIMLRVDLDDLMNPIDLMLDDPIGDFSVFSTYLVSRAARDHVTVVLSGDGGDELFGGYDTYIADRVARVYGLLGRRVTRKWMPSLMSMVPPSRAKKGIVNRAKVFVAGASREADLGHMRWMVFADDRLRRGLFTEAFAEQLAGADVVEHVRRLRSKCRFSDSLSRCMYVDSAFYLPENILHKVDRTSMAVSLETRVPLLDHRVVESALTMPSRFRIRGTRRKSILKRAFADLLPQAIIRRSKEGFSTPMKHWLRGPLKPMMQDVLGSDRIRRDGYFNSEAVDRLQGDHLAERADHAHVLWSMMLFCMWQDKFQSARSGPVLSGNAEVVKL